MFFKACAVQHHKNNNTNNKNYNNNNNNVEGQRVYRGLIYGKGEKEKELKDLEKAIKIAIKKYKIQNFSMQKT